MERAQRPRRPFRLPPLTRDRLPLSASVEAILRVALALVRNDGGIRSRRGLLRYPLRAAYFLAVAPFRPRLEASVGDLRYVVPTSDRTIARSLFAGGDWEPLEVDAAYAALAAAGYDDFDGKTFLEVGANLGMTSIGAVAERGFAAAIAFEPEPGLFELLCENIRRNGLGDRIRPIPLALSNRADTLLLETRAGNAGDNRIVASDRNGETTVAIHATTLDREVEQGSVDLTTVGLVWMDVQGHEPDVLAGASALLESGIPIVLEYSTDMLRAAQRLDWLETVAMEHYAEFVDLGWSALTGRIAFQPVSELPRLSAGRRKTDTNLLLVARRPEPSQQVFETGDFGHNGAPRHPQGGAPGALSA